MGFAHEFEKESVRGRELPGRWILDFVMNLTQAALGPEGVFQVPQSAAVESRIARDFALIKSGG